MDNLKKISVIMAVYNNEKYLKDAIESILNQTYSNFEFIIINDCSNDGSEEIIKYYKNIDKRIILINNEKNLGLPASLNKGLQIANGDYIARMDGDDISLPDRFELQLNYLENNKNVFLIGSGAIIIDEDGNYLINYKPVTGFNNIKKRLLNKKNSFYHPTIMFRNEKKYFYREKFKYAQDYDLYMNLLSDNKILENISDALIKYRISPNTISLIKQKIQKEYTNIANKLYFQRLKDNKDSYETINFSLYLSKLKNINKEKDEFYYNIYTNFIKSNYLLTKKFCWKYFKNFGILNKFFIYFLILFLPEKIIFYIKNKIL